MAKVDRARAAYTPCIGICSSGIGDDVCRGCKRFAAEVVEWNGYTASQREAVQARLDMLLDKIIDARIQVIDGNKLRAALDRLGLEYRPQASLQWGAYILLRRLAGAGSTGRESSADTDALRGAGIIPQVPLGPGSIARLFADIDREYYALSVAHYERYFHPGVHRSGI